MRVKLLMPCLAAGGLLAIFAYTQRLRSQIYAYEPDNFFTTPFPPLDDPDVEPKEFHPPLRTQGRYIVNSRDERVKLASVNWYGGSDLLFIPGGLDVCYFLFSWICFLGGSGFWRWIGSWK